MAELPQFILLKSRNDEGYLSLSKQEEGASTAAFLHISHNVELPGSENASQSVESEDRPLESWEKTTELEYLMFEVEKAKTVEGLVHIRSFSNSKYLVRESVDNELIVAEANVPEEDQSKCSCTLFQFQAFFWGADDDSNSKTVELFHFSQHHKGTVTLNNQFQLVVAQQKERFLDVADADADDSSDDDFLRHCAFKIPFCRSRTVVAIVFNVVDAVPAATLPEYVAFKGRNGRYLVSETNSDGKTRLLFKTSDIGETGVAQRISYSPSNDFNTMKIVDQGTGAYWTTNPPRRMRSSSHAHHVTVGPEEMATLFYPMKFRNYIAIKCLSTNTFAIAKETPTAANREVMYLASNAPTISNDAYLTVEEPVLEREIIDAIYDLDNSKIYYNSSIIEKYIDSRSNYTDVEQKGTFQVEYKVSKTMSWNQSTTVNLGIKATLSAGIPYIGTLGVQISSEHTPTWAWGEQQTEEKTVMYSQEIRIPPRKKVILRVLSEKAWCDVPFSCKVRDIMTWGELREYEVTDGVYTGCNEFRLETRITDEDLPIN